MPENNELEATDVAEAIDSNAVLKELLEEVRRLREEADSSRESFQQDLDAARAEAAAARRASMDAFAPKPDASWIDPRTDRPGNIEEKLDAYERQALEFGEKFDRERTRRSLLGLPIENPNPWVWNGRAFETEEALEDYKSKIELERERTIGKYPR